MRVLSWNIEGFKRNVFTLASYLSLSNSSLVFLSEPQLFLCDAELTFSSLCKDFKYHLNSDDAINHDLPLLKRKAWGGTMALWHVSLDPFVSILPSTSSSVLPL